MSENINAEIVAIGTEILLGEITDTNSVHIAKVLRDIGINLFYMTSVGDNKERIMYTIHLALERSDVVITCGGLGPTVDDMTRQGIAGATGRELIFHQELLDQIAARFASFRVRMTENNRQQAYLPADSIVIENPVGTAPSFIVEHEGKSIISLPGVPREMKYLMAEAVVPYLRKKYKLGIIKARLLQTAGIGESTLDDMIGQSLLQQNNPTVGLAAHQGSVDVRITAKASSETEADQMLDAVEAQIRERIGDHIYGIDNTKLEQVLVDLLNKHNATLAVLQAGIDNAVIECVRKIDFENRVLINSQQYKHPDELRQTYNFDPNMTLRDMASKSAMMLRESSGASVSVVILSYPDLEEDEDQKQATALCIQTETESRSRVYGFGAQFELARHWVTNWSMAAVWRLFKNENEVKK